MKILITGITGLMGSYLAREFSVLGEIHGLKRPDSNLDLLGELAETISWHEGDILDYQSLERAFECMDMIIHAAGLVSYQDKDEKALLRTNCEGTTNVVNVMLNLGIPQLIHISSVAALGRNPELKIIDEQHKWVDSPYNTPYGISKYLGELEAWRGAQEGLKVMVLNPALLLGKIADKRSSTAIYQYVLDENQYYPKGSVNYIDIRDAAKIALALFQKDQWGERFILNKECLPYKTFFETLALGLGKKPPKRPVNGFLIRFVLTLNWLKKLIGIGNSPLNKQTAQIAQQQLTFDNQKVNRLLDFPYTDLEQTIQWAMNEN